MMIMVQQKISHLMWSMRRFFITCLPSYKILADEFILIYLNYFLLFVFIFFWMFTALLLYILICFSSLQYTFWNIKYFCRERHYLYPYVLNTEFVFDFNLVQMRSTHWKTFRKSYLKIYICYHKIFYMFRLIFAGDHFLLYW